MKSFSFNKMAVLLHFIVIMKSRFGRFVLLYLACMLYLSGTGMVYVLRTCMHSGKASITWSIQKQTASCCIQEKKSERCCEKLADDGCNKNEAEEDCMKDKIQYKKPDLSSVQPINDELPVISFIVTYYSLIPFIAKHPALIYLPDEFFKINHPPPDNLIPSSLESRIIIGSFIC